jgi:hypothetical protein
VSRHVSLLNPERWASSGAVRNEGGAIGPDLGRVDTSAESARKSGRLATRLRDRIVNLARKAGAQGLTINDAERTISDHKSQSVSPRFAELVARGALVRVPIEPGRPTKRFPFGMPRCVRRYDEQTRRKVIVHWAPEFAPAPGGEYCTPDQSAVEDTNSAATSMGTQIEGGADL